MKNRSAFVPVLLLMVACATTPRPTVLGQVDAVHEATATQEAAKLSPQGFGRAEQLRQQAEEAFEKGDVASAQILGERALAAYQRARVLARIVEAEQRLAQSQASLDESQKQLGALEARQQAAKSELADLDAQIQVEQDAEPIAKPGPASAAREAARRESARAAVAQARLLCLSAQLVGGNAASGAADLLSSADALDARLAKAPVPTPIDEAIKLRSRCLNQLVEVRRPKRAQAPASSEADRLAADLSQAGLSPARDLSGVGVTLLKAFSGTKLSSEAKASTEKVGLIAKSRPNFPLLVVIHSARGEASTLDRERGEAAAALLRSAGAGNVRVLAVGARLPRLDPERPRNRTQNERLELLFVSPIG